MEGFTFVLQHMLGWMLYYFFFFFTSMYIFGAHTHLSVAGTQGRYNKRWPGQEGVPSWVPPGQAPEGERRGDGGWVGSREGGEAAGGWSGGFASSRPPLPALGFEPERGGLPWGLGGPRWRWAISSSPGGSAL